MAKKIRIVLTLQLPAGKATPAPPVGTALGPHGINIVEFTKSYNEKTADKAGQVIPAQITIYEDRSFTFVLKTPPAADLLRKAAGVEKGGATSARQTRMASQETSAAASVVLRAFLLAGLMPREETRGRGGWQAGGQTRAEGAPAGPPAARSGRGSRRRR